MSQTLLAMYNILQNPNIFNRSRETVLSIPFGDEKVTQFLGFPPTSVSHLKLCILRMNIYLCADPFGSQTSAGRSQVCQNGVFHRYVLLFITYLLLTSAFQGRHKNQASKDIEHRTDFCHLVIFFNRSKEHDTFTCGLLYWLCCCGYVLQNLLSRLIYRQLKLSKLPKFLMAAFYHSFQFACSYV